MIEFSDELIELINDWADIHGLDRQDVITVLGGYEICIGINNTALRGAQLILEEIDKLARAQKEGSKT